METPPVYSAIPVRHYLTLNSGDGILLSQKGKLNLEPVSGGTAKFTAANTASVNNTDFTPFAAVNIAANTINLYNVAFGGTVNLTSLNGMWHNGTSVYGYVNDLGLVTYNGELVNAENNTTGTLPGTGITLHARLP